MQSFKQKIHKVIWSQGYWSKTKYVEGALSTTQTAPSKKIE